MKKWTKMTWILLSLLGFSSANCQTLAGVGIFMNWPSSLIVKKEDVEHVDKYRLDASKKLQLCLKAASASPSQIGCTNTPFLSNPSSVNNLPLLEAEKICQTLDQGEYYITPEANQTVMDYVVKCRKSPDTSVIISRKKLCSPQTSGMEDDKNQFCPSSNENCADLREENKQLREEIERLKAKIKELEQASQVPSCEIITNADKRITVAIKNYQLQFVKVDSTYRMGKKKGINIALTEQQANDFHRQAKELSQHSQPIYPNIFKAVSKVEMRKHVGKFWIQEQTINPQLYGEIITGGSADRVSYDDAMQVIKTLNDWCAGKAQFQLPEEKQFVHLAKLAYDPIKNGLQRCQDVREKVALDHIKQLFAHQWQLTSSYCSAIDNNRACNDEQTRIKKGGSHLSQYAAECMPEYRAESMPDIREPNTTIRLVLKLIK